MCACRRYYSVKLARLNEGERMRYFSISNVVLRLCIYGVPGHPHFIDAIL